MRVLIMSAAGMVMLAAHLACAQPEALAASPALSNVVQIWQLRPEERKLPQRIHTEVVVWYFDPDWDVAWGECNGISTYLPLADCPQMFQPGLRVALDGVIFPEREQFDWSRTTIRVLGKSPLPAEPVTSLNLGNAFNSRMIRAEGLVDTLQEDSTHLIFRILNGPVPALAYALKSTNTTKVAAGDFIRFRGVYASEQNRDKALTAVTLFLPDADEIEVTSNLKKDKRFEGPVRSSLEINESSPTNEIYVVEGVVRGHDPGKWLTLWDKTGQIMVQSHQMLAVRIGQRVRAIGYPQMIGLEQCLRDGLYRLADVSADDDETAAPERIYLAEQVRTLRLERVRQMPKVSLRATVSWSHPNFPFVYVQDASGGIKVLNPTWVGTNTSKPGTIVTVEGSVVEDEFVPAITNAVLSRAGWSGNPQSPFVSFEQAMTGTESGRKIEMRGYVRQVIRTNGLLRFDLSTGSGEFRAWSGFDKSLLGLAGSVIRVSGVCVARANSKRQLTGIELWVADYVGFVVEEPKPDDPFAIPLRPLASLRQFNIERTLNRRVRTVGTVVHQAVGRYLHIQDGADGLFVLTHQTNRLETGDRVEVVGFPGNEGRKFLLREAAYRRVASGTQPEPVRIPTGKPVDVDLEGLLARSEGTLFNVFKKESELVLLMQAGTGVFEAHLNMDENAGLASEELSVGSRLGLTGVYQIQSDEHGAPRSFRLNLRNWEDIRILQRPPWWTVSRLFWTLALVLAVFGVALVWAVMMSRKNTLLHQAQTELERANDELELRVEKRTQELSDQVEAKERARSELALTQRRLIAASRQAGMAEVATGVLHNVGNVLNSVNVSATLVADRLRNSRIELVARCAALLQKPDAELTRYLLEDPKGKSFPSYLEQLGRSLEQEKGFICSEMDLLTKNVEHIKVIVSMQQSHAKSGGVLEEVDPKDLLDDALQIQSAGLERHGIQVIVNCDPAPRLILDRHKVLQILINLVSNAKWALDSRASDKQLRCSLRTLDGERLQFVVEDNGIGIAADNLSRIFSQGFTTRRDGHGFGLHSGANSARELGGSLTVTSDGVGCGARFTLELPLNGKDGAATSEIAGSV